MKQKSSKLWAIPIGNKIKNKILIGIALSSDEKKDSEIISESFSYIEYYNSIWRYYSNIFVVICDIIIS